jgi:hypothetical protein
MELISRHDGHAVFSRAYVLFKSPETVIEFRQAYDGHVFRAKTGLWLRTTRSAITDRYRRGISGGGRVLSHTEDSTQREGKGGWQAGND